MPLEEGELRVFLLQNLGHTSLLLHDSSWKQHFFSFTPNRSADTLTHITTLQSPTLRKLMIMPQHHLIPLPKSGDPPSPVKVTPVVFLKSVTRELLYQAPSLEPDRLGFLDRLGHYHNIGRSTSFCLPFCSFLNLIFVPQPSFPLWLLNSSSRVYLVLPQYFRHIWFETFKTPISVTILLYHKLQLSFSHLLFPDNYLHPTAKTLLLLFSLLPGKHVLLIQHYICLCNVYKMFKIFTDKWKLGQLIWVVKEKNQP